MPKVKRKQRHYYKYASKGCRFWSYSGIAAISHGWSCRYARR